MVAMKTARTGLGALYVLAPELIPGILGVPTDRRARRVIRVLGARYLIQAAVVWTVPERRWALAVGGGVDAIHAVTMALLAAADRPRRRLAGTDAAVAATFALAGWRRAHRLTDSDARRR
jgi:hypothetical protein